ncbi:hypothetical protein GUITHDRAFT_154192 [Guillardia theta CCMP2712]|uniref:Uncharacterized protein n=1 Tax=Guillardia theta (strain CCMP2712) TaxID=905079 RepID=L1IWG7_GUITC|nr:hypothetical protein GUITHDRAFT_154192 [Guillardia theta CCMP2712]EKX40219.1 hypothetical protein GUITHDRAFT_154192 [Guillardia theta CCMP2712]|eukprot:XP_005827199.1 hypothetical protein GUITHDRAFT_154192 [Guillardia theta CCMP2712]
MSHDESMQSRTISPRESTSTLGTLLFVILKLHLPSAPSLKAELTRILTPEENFIKGLHVVTHSSLSFVASS